MQADAAGAQSPPRSRFVERLLTALTAGTLVRVVLSSPRDAAGDVRRETARMVDLRDRPVLSVVSQESTRDVTRNLGLDEVEVWLTRSLGQRFAAALLETTESDWQWRAAKGAGRHERLVRHAPRSRQAPARGHDTPKYAALDDSARDWLAGLGLTDAAGAPLPSRRHKHQQLQRFAELLGHLVDDAAFESSAPLQVVDMGCGRGALTFAAWHYLRRQRGFSAKVRGVEAQPAMAAVAHALAQRIGAEGLAFVPGTIAETPLDHVDILLALHACNTATDDALLRGIRCGARLLVVAPCCHQEVRPQLDTEGSLAPLLRHGLLATRFSEWLTDGYRALALEWAGYRVKVIEFVDPEHTPRNLLLAAVREPHRQPFTDEARRAQLLDLRHQFGLRKLALDALLPT